MTTFQVLTLMISFGMLVLMLSKDKENLPIGKPLGEARGLVALIL
ncbi:putative holin-like toxin [Sporolactobacillus pectinivorans]|nr:putative holin-like toxin [Sporolactobacillus pectinivorans]